MVGPSRPIVTPLPGNCKRRHLTANRRLRALLFDASVLAGRFCVCVSASVDDPRPDSQIWRFIMNMKTCGCTVLMLAVATGLVAQTWTPTQFSGAIHDYSPATTVTPMGPWKMHGSWTLTLDGTGKGDFSAALTMEL